MPRPTYQRVRTQKETQHRIFLLVAALGSVQFFLNGLAIIVASGPMVGLWFGAGLSAAGGSIAFEMYKSKQARW